MLKIKIKIGWLKFYNACSKNYCTPISSYTISTGTWILVVLGILLAYKIFVAILEKLKPIMSESRHIDTCIVSSWRFLKYHVFICSCESVITTYFQCFEQTMQEYLCDNKNTYFLHEHTT